MTAEKHSQSLILHAIQSGKHDSDTKRTANTAKTLSKYVYKLTNSVFLVFPFGLNMFQYLGALISYVSNKI